MTETSNPSNADPKALEDLEMLRRVIPVLEAEINGLKAQLAAANSRSAELSARVGTLEAQLADRTNELSEAVRNNQQLRRMLRDAAQVPQGRTFTPQPGLAANPAPPTPTAASPAGATPTPRPGQPRPVIASAASRSSSIPGSLDAVSRATQSAKAGLQCLTAMQYGRARELFAEARALHDDKRYAALESVAQGLQFQAGRFLDKARASFDAALKLDPACPEAKSAMQALDAMSTSRPGRR